MYIEIHTCPMFPFRTIGKSTAPDDCGKHNFWKQLLYVNPGLMLAGTLQGGCRVPTF